MLMQKYDSYDKDYIIWQEYLYPRIIRLDETMGDMTEGMDRFIKRKVNIEKYMNKLKETK